jgi:hypothetical protein
MQDDTTQQSNQYQNPVDGKTYVADDGWKDYSPQNPQPVNPDAKVILEGVRLLTDQQTIAANLSSEQLGDYVKAVTASIEPVVQEAATSFQVMMQFELKPNEKVVIQIASQGEVGDDTLQKVYNASLSVEAPQPTQQPISFQATYTIKP